MKAQTSVKAAGCQKSCGCGGLDLNIDINVFVGICL
jgi:hypothetical protein